jgi:hypothetical protein
LRFLHQVLDTGQSGVIADRVDPNPLVCVRFRGLF